MKSLFIILILSFAAKSCNETKTIYVADHLVDCTGVAPQKCMLIKENKLDDWANFYGNIKGFEYEAGFEYVLKVKIETLKNPPADGSSLKYTLVEVLEKKTKKQVTLYNNWKIIFMERINSFEKKPTIKFDSNNNSVSGFAGCNNFFGKFELDKQTISFSKMGMTRKMCPNMAQENTFINDFKEVNQFKINGKQLSLYDKNNELLFLCELEE